MAYLKMEKNIAKTLFMIWQQNTGLKPAFDIYKLQRKNGSRISKLFNKYYLTNAIEKDN